MAREQITHDEAVTALRRYQFEYEQAKTKAEANEVLKAAGQKVGYTPAFRCLVMNQTPEDSVRW